MLVNPQVRQYKRHIFPHNISSAQYTWEKLTITGRICATQSWGSNNFPRAAQPSTARSRTESWSTRKSQVLSLYIYTPSRLLQNTYTI
jgi:hypothetical protein